MTHIREDMPSENHQHRKTGMAACGRRCAKGTMVLIRSHSPSVKSVAGNERISGRPSEGWNSRGAAPAAVLWAMFILKVFISQERGIYFSMNTAINQKSTVPVVREYKIGDMTYIVKAVVKDGAKEDAATKIRRMIRNDMQQAKNHK